MIRIADDILRMQRLGFLEKLLYDRTTKQNILWGTDAHAALGEDFLRDREIHESLITGDHSGVIKTRAEKEKSQQNDRTRQHGEVSTPFWVCKKMNDYADEEWFGRKGIFDIESNSEGHIEFPKGKTWTAYVDSRRLEITCGEAPFLVSPYDASTGEEIPLKERTGILDRKLRIVNENTREEETWLKWTFRAFEASYGYEFQGDNLLIARINFIRTFEDYLSARWGRSPTEKEYQRLVKIITWNLWQMDGLTGRIPYSRPEEEFYQMSLFDFMEGPHEETEENSQPGCRIYDWRAKKSVEYNSLKAEG